SCLGFAGPLKQIQNQRTPEPAAVKLTAHHDIFDLPFKVHCAGNEETGNAIGLHHECESPWAGRVKEGMISLLVPVGRAAGRALHSDHFSDVSGSGSADFQS